VGAKVEKINALKMGTRSSRVTETCVALPAHEAEPKFLVFWSYLVSLGYCVMIVIPR
jgi:hypothetical protein